MVILQNVAPLVAKAIDLDKELAYELKKSGLPLSDGILTMDELVAELKQLKGK